MDIVERHPGHDFTRVFQQRKVLIASSKESTNAPGDATQEFFRRMASTGYLGFEDEDASRVSAMCRVYRVQLEHSKIEESLQSIFNYQPLQPQPQPQPPDNKPSRKQRQLFLRSQRRTRLIGQEQLRLREAYAARVNSCILVTFLMSDWSIRKLLCHWAWTSKTFRKSRKPWFPVSYRRKNVLKDEEDKISVGLIDYNKPITLYSYL